MYTTALTDNAVRGLVWFLHGMNGILIPRGVFFDSDLFKRLNGSWDPSSPLAGANINGNDNKGSAHLNSRVIQMVITKNITLADAYRTLDFAWTNTTGSDTAFALRVAQEFYTIGFLRVVDDLVPNAVVENSGSYSAPPPSPTLWELFWNTIAGIASAIWNAVVAVAQFILNVFKWLASVAIGIAIGLTTGNWTYFQENVLEPLRKALEALVKFVMDLINALIDAILKPILSPFVEMMRRSFASLALAFHFSRLTITQQFFAVVGSIVTAITIITVALLVIELATIVFTGWVPGLIPTLIGLLRPIILAVFISQAISGSFGVLTVAESGREPSSQVLEGFFGGWLGGLESTYGIIQGVWGAVGELTRGGIFSPAVGLALAIIGLVIAVWGQNVASGLWLLALDAVAVLLAVYGVVATAIGGGFAWGSLSWAIRLETVLTVASAIGTWIVIGERALDHENTYGI